MLRKGVVLQRKRSFILVVVLVIGLISVMMYTMSGEKTGEALFKNRCSKCHKLPDIKTHLNLNWEMVIKTMRNSQGADAYINDEEAKKIVEYLTRRTEEIKIEKGMGGGKSVP